MAPEAVPAALRSPQRCYETVAYPFVLLHSKTASAAHAIPSRLRKLVLRPHRVRSPPRGCASRSYLRRPNLSLACLRGLVGRLQRRACASQPHGTHVNHPAGAGAEKLRGGWCARATEQTAVTEKLARSTAEAARRAGGMPPRAARAGRRRKRSPAPGSSARPHQRPGAAAALLHILRARLRRDLNGAQVRS